MLSCVVSAGIVENCSERSASSSSMSVSSPPAPPAVPMLMSPWRVRSSSESTRVSAQLCMESTTESASVSSSSSSAARRFTSELSTSVASIEDAPTGAVWKEDTLAAEWLEAAEGERLTAPLAEGTARVSLAVSMVWEVEEAEERSARSSCCMAGLLGCFSVAMGDLLFLRRVRFGAGGAGSGRDWMRSTLSYNGGKGDWNLNDRRSDSINGKVKEEVIWAFPAPILSFSWGEGR